MSKIEVFSVAAAVAPHPAAAGAARDILIEGGNAIEAAVAAAAVAAVACPERAGLLGDALWLIREPGRAGRVRVLDARGPACAAATLALYRQEEATSIPARGAAAALTVPGAMAGWHAALALSAALGGRLPVSRLLEAAVALARAGVPVVRPAPADLDTLAALPGFANAFLDDGRWPAPDTIRPAPRLADTLSYLAQAGLADAARGDVAREMAVDCAALGSPLDRADFKRFEARWRPPLTVTAGGRTVETAPTRPGLDLALSLAVLDGVPRAGLAAPWRALAEAQARVATALDEGRDPMTLLTPAALAAAVAAFGHGAVPKPSPPRLPGEAGAFIGVIDAQGLAVSLVASMGLSFGAGVVLPRTGLLLNDRGAAFALWSGDGPVLRPGRRPPLDALPLVSTTRDGQVAVLGIAGTAAPAAALAARQGRDLAEAVAAPRLRPGRDPDGDPAWLAEAGHDPDFIMALRRDGLAVVETTENGFGEGGALQRPPGGRIEAAADPRTQAEADGI